jgi:2-methylcitrate dehydratase PrpD
MKMMTDDPGLALAQHVCPTSYADLPASAVESARRDILDTFGCMLGGSGSPAIGELFAVVLEAFSVFLSALSGDRSGRRYSGIGAIGSGKRP